MARVWVGDSRGVGLKDAVGTSNGDRFIVSGGQAYPWFSGTAVNQIKSVLSTDPGADVIIMMGVNDVANSLCGGYLNADKYASTINSLITSYPKANFYFVSVNPVDGDYKSVYDKVDGVLRDYEMNSEMKKFNSIIKSSCNAKYIDCNSFLMGNGFSTSDGIHYREDTSRVIYDFVVDGIGSSNEEKFVSREVAPESDSPYFIHVDGGGYNRCIKVTGNSVLPNCTGYAWGRFMEIMGATTCSLSVRNAELWYSNTSDGYARGLEPRLGAVICWAKGTVDDGTDGAGHVAIVEKINSDGSIVTSESGWKREKKFWTTTRANNGNWGAGSSYKFQGFIYNPAVSPDAVQTSGVPGSYGSDGGINLSQGDTSGILITKQYEFYSGITNSDVISWTPEFTGSLMGFVKAGDVVSIDPVKNEMMEYSVGGTTYSGDVAKGMKLMGLSAESFSNLERKAANMWARYSRANITATLEVMGDPTIKVGTHCYVAVYTKYGFLHHTSGIYRINAVDDSISGGTFVSTLTLQKVGSSINPASSYVTE